MSHAYLNNIEGQHNYYQYRDSSDTRQPHADNSQESVFNDYFESQADYSSDSAQLQEDYSYFQSLASAMQSGDTEAIDEILSLQTLAVIDGDDPNAIQQNTNTAYLEQLKQEAQSYTSKDMDNPFS